MTTEVVPKIRARGNTRSGSLIGRPVKVTLFQADCEKSGPIIAFPNSSKSAAPPATPRPGIAVSLDQPLAAASHHDDVHAALSRFVPSKMPTTMRPKSAAVLVKVNEF